MTTKATAKPRKPRAIKSKPAKLEVVEVHHDDTKLWTGLALVITSVPLMINGNRNGGVVLMEGALHLNEYFFGPIR
jgi:hypothetical protein